MAETGPTMALVCGILLMVAGPLGMLTFGMLNNLLAIAHTSWSAIGINPTPFYVNFLVTLVWGVLGVVGARMAKNERMAGAILCVLAGIASIAGLFIPISAAHIVRIGSQLVPMPAINLSTTFLFAEPFLLLIGGIICVVKLKGTGVPKTKSLKTVTKDVI